MASTTLTIKPSTHTHRGQKKISIEIDAAQFERMAANFGFFNTDFLESIGRAEREVAHGDIKRLRSLRDLRGGARAHG